MGGRKSQLRAHALTARRALHPSARAAAEAAIRSNVLALPEVAAASTIAAYVAFGSEPATAELVHELAERGARVIVPILLDDLDLDWVQHHADTASTEAQQSADVSARLGREAIAGVDVVIVPALAVDETGIRLGRGGGSYDRALARVGPDAAVLALLYDGEVLPDVAAESHDRGVNIAVTPSRVWRFATAPSLPRS